MTEVDWTFAMATAWVFWRTESAVRACWHKYRMECWDWRNHSGVFPGHRRSGPRKVSGWRLLQREPLAAKDVLVLSHIGLDGEMVVLTAGEAERAIVAALRSGRLTAYGAAHSGADVVPIPKSLWKGLSPFTLPQRKGPHDAVYSSDGSPRFVNVMVEREEVMRVWPETPAAAASEDMKRERDRLDGKLTPPAVECDAVTRELPPSLPSDLLLLMTAPLHSQSASPTTLCAAPAPHQRSISQSRMPS